MQISACKNRNSNIIWISIAESQMMIQILTLLFSPQVLHIISFRTLTSLQWHISGYRNWIFILTQQPLFQGEAYYWMR